MPKQKFSNIQILTIANAIRKLDPVFIAAANPTEQAKEVQNFKFDGEVIYSLAVTLKNIQPIVENVDKVRLSLIKKYDLDNKKNANYNKNHASFVDEYTRILDKQEEVEILTIKKDDLNLKENKIPITVLSDLLGSVIIN
jgi:hypothetical protein